MSFPGSLFFTESKFVDNKVFIPEEYEIPLFMNERIRIINRNKKLSHFLKKHIKSYKNIYNDIVIKDKTLANEEESLLPAECDDSAINTKKRFTTDDNSSLWKLPPNRYTIKGNNLSDNVNKKMGKKGFYQCFTVSREPSTIIGHSTPSNFQLSKTQFYNVTNGINKLLHPRNYFIQKIRKGSRNKQKTYLRFMLNDLTLCPKDPTQPGPNKYYPQNFSIKTKPVLKRQHAKKLPILFYQFSCVPQNERFFNIKINNIKPDPCRYHPLEIACPCNEYAYMKDRDTLNLPGKRLKELMKLKTICGTTHQRNIIGHGHSSIFRSKVYRLVRPFKLTANTDKLLLKMHLDGKYLTMIKYPNRKPLSFPLIEMPHHFKMNKLRFNSIERPMKRTKLKTNKRIGFMSGCPRFKYLEELRLENITSTIEVISDTKKNANSRTLSKPSIRNYVKPKEESTIFERLQKLPKRLAILRNKNSKPIQDKIITFQPLPLPRLLINESDFEVKQENLQTLMKPLELEEYLKSIYKNDLKITCIDLEQIPNDINFSSLIKLLQKS